MIETVYLLLIDRNDVVHLWNSQYIFALCVPLTKASYLSQKIATGNLLYLLVRIIYLYIYISMEYAYMLLVIRNLLVSILPLWICWLVQVEDCADVIF